MVSRRVGHAIESAMTELLRERARIDAALNELQQIARSFDGGAATPAGRKVGRKVGKRKAVKAVGKAAKVGTAGKKTAAVRKTGGWTPAKRRAAAARMKRYWAERRKSKQAGGGEV